MVSVSLKTFHNKFVVAEPNGNVLGNRDGAGPWESFLMTFDDKERNKVSFRSHHGKYLSLDSNGLLTASKDTAGSNEWFEVVENKGVISLRGANGKFVCAEKAEKNFIVGANSTEIKEYETFTFIHNLPSKIAIRSENGKFLSIDQEGVVLANQDAPGPTETFTVEKLGNSQYNFKSFFNKYLSFEEKNNKVVADREKASGTETWMAVAGIKNGTLAFRCSHARFFISGKRWKS